MSTIDNYDFTGKKVLVRVDFNVPLNNDLEVTDDTRIRAAVPTIQKLLGGGASVILMSHLGRPKAGPEDRFSLKHLIVSIADALGKDIKFAPDCIGETTRQAVAQLQPGEVLLLENLRFHAHETAGTESFAKELADLADCYINDAFGTAHRAHASTTIIARFFPHDKMFGYLISSELQNIGKVLDSPKPPVTAVMGGAKVSSKIPIIENLLERVDHLIIGGGMAYTFVKANGGNIGNSLVEDSHLDTALRIQEKCVKQNVQLHLPIDTVIADTFDNDANRQTVAVGAIPDEWMGLDIGPETEALYQKVISGSKTILWNGPMGVFEMSHFEDGTKAIGSAIAEATANGAYSLIGGGDSVAAVNQFGLKEKVSYVSTGGGALLEYMEGKTLPGIAAILQP